ncbi:MAG: hypothetical protein IJU47_01620 [Verrucomicrobia bacterium]|nr:hypothetical protein [Verrucomicrobiota bacterium]
MKKQFLIFSTLCLGMLGSFELYAQTESPAAEKTPGEQLIEFMLNPPQKYDMGGSTVNTFRSQPTYFRMKVDKDMLFYGFSTKDQSVANRSDLGKVDSYFSAWSRYQNEYWKTIGKNLTLWTNTGKASEMNNPILQKEKDMVSKALNYISLFSFSEEEAIVKGPEGNFIIQDKQKEKKADVIFEMDEQGYLKTRTILYPSPQNVSEENPTYALGNRMECSYQKGKTPDFFPSEIKVYDLIGKFNSTEIQTNFYSSYIFDHLDLDPQFSRKDFALGENEGDTDLKIYWVSGTNVLYKTSEGTPQRVLTDEEVIQNWDEQKKLTSSQPAKNRGIYIVLAVIAFLGHFFLILKKSNRKNRS